MLARMGVNERLTFPPIDVPQDDLRKHGFRLQSPASLSAEFKSKQPQ